VPAPIAPRRKHEWTRPTGNVIDDWAWLSNREDPEVIHYLEAENSHTNEWLSSHRTIIDTLFAEIKSRIQETDMSVPVRNGDWWYVSRTTEGLDYQTHCRGRTKESADQQVILDENTEAVDHDFFSLQCFDLSCDQNLLAWSADIDGSEKATIKFRDLLTGIDLADELAGTTWGGTAWSTDGTHFFYVTPDDAMRPWRVWRHKMGTPQAADMIVFEEPDERFFVGIGLTRSERFVVIDSASKTSAEVHIIDATNPQTAIQLVSPRRDDIEYSIDDWGDQLVILTNVDAVDFKLCSANLDSPSEWTDLVPHLSGRRITGVEAFRDHLVMTSWTNGQQTISVVTRDGVIEDLDQPSVPCELELESNPNWDSDSVRFTRQSLCEPPGVYEQSLVDKTTTTLKLTPVPNTDLASYVSTREWARSVDGTLVPVDIVHHVDTPLDGTAPCVVYAYGAYEISIPPWFSVARLSLLDRGFIWALVHPRGGGEMGRNWYFEGRLMAKANTFADVNYAAMHLVTKRIAAADKLIVRGGSAGGLMVGACINRDPELWAGAIAEVPFVDVVNTMSDPSMPLTVTEWEEWGDPRVEPWASYMLSYSPYDNIDTRNFPAIFATAGINDPRVSYHEPAKWIAKIRSCNTGNQPILFKCEMGAGHGGASGRYDRWRDEAEIVAFCLSTSSVI